MPHLPTLKSFPWNACSYFSFHIFRKVSDLCSELDLSIWDTLSWRSTSFYRLLFMLTSDNLFKNRYSTFFLGILDIFFLLSLNLYVMFGLMTGKKSQAINNISKTLFVTLTVCQLNFFLSENKHNPQFCTRVYVPVRSNQLHTTVWYSYQEAPKKSPISDLIKSRVQDSVKYVMGLSNSLRKVIFRRRKRDEKWLSKSFLKRKVCMMEKMGGKDASNLAPNKYFLSSRLCRGAQWNKAGPKPLKLYKAN